MQMAIPSAHVPSSRGQASSLTLRDVSLTLSGRQVLHDLSFQTQAQRLGIVGRNGSGKSTLARVLAGLIAPTAGQACVNGHNLSKDRKAALTEVGILFQNPDHQIIFPTVLEEVTFGLSQLGKPNAEALALETLERFHKSHWRDTNISMLSQGQKHLVCLMSVTAMAPKLLILDEPFAGLDIPTKAQLNRYLSHYQGSLLHITHDPADLAGYDHLIWLEKGTVKDSGPCGPVRERYTAHMIALGEQDDISDLSG